MKRLIPIVLAAVFLCPLSALAQSGGCDAKQQSIKNELDYAQAYRNTARVRGLRHALAEVKAHCTDATLRSAGQKKVLKAQETLARRERDLQDAKAQGKSRKKIADRQRKVDRAHIDLEQAMIDAGR